VREAGARRTAHAGAPLLYASKDAEHDARQAHAAGAVCPFPETCLPREGDYRMKTYLVAALAALSLNLAVAVEVDGSKFDDRTRVGSSELVVNGAGIRKKAVFKVYAMALYLPEKHADAEGAVGARGAKRVSISLLRDLSAQQFVEALQEGMTSNHSEAEMAGLKDRLKQFSDALLALGEAKTGTSVVIDWLPESGTRLTVNGQVKGKDIAGEDFYKALLRIWLGRKPVQDDLKQALLGKAA